MAAEILIKSFDDPGESGFKRGDPIDIQAGGFQWGAAEGDPSLSFVVVITDRTPEQMQRYLEPWFSDTETDGDGLPAVVAVRRYRALNTPLDWQADLAATGRIVREWDQVAPFVWDKMLEKTEEDAVFEEAT